MKLKLMRCGYPKTDEFGDDRRGAGRDVQNTDVYFLIEMLIKRRELL